MYLTAFNRAAGRNSKFHDRNPELHACCEESDHTRQRGSKNPGRSSPRVLISIVERELLQSFSQLGPVWLRLARKKAPSERRSGVARSKGVLEHRAFAPRPEHEFWMTHISGEGGDAAQSRWHQKDRKHQPEGSDTKKHSISTSCDHMHSIHLPMHLSTW